MSRTSAPVFPCSCPEGWKPEGWAYCAECYEGKIERLTAALKLARGAIEDCHRYRSHIHFDELNEIDKVLDWSRGLAVSRPPSNTPNPHGEVK